MIQFLVLVIVSFQLRVKAGKGNVPANSCLCLVNLLLHYKCTEFRDCQNNSV